MIGHLRVLQLTENSIAFRQRAWWRGGILQKIENWILKTRDLAKLILKTKDLFAKYRKQMNCWGRIKEKALMTGSRLITMNSEKNQNLDLENKGLRPTDLENKGLNGRI